MASKVMDLVKSSKGYMSFIDYWNVAKDDNKEFLRGDMWEFTFINAPKIVYYPGDDIFKKRLTQVNIGIDSSVNGFEKRVRGNYTVFQKTGQNTAGSLTLGFVDREDQALLYFFDDWRQKIADRDCKYSFRKDDLVADCQMVLTNSSRIAVRTLKFYNCIIQDAPMDENGVAEDGTDRSDLQLTMNFEHYERLFNNI